MLILDSAADGAARQPLHIPDSSSPSAAAAALDVVLQQVLVGASAAAGDQAAPAQLQLQRLVQEAAAAALVPADRPQLCLLQGEQATVELDTAAAAAAGGGHAGLLIGSQDATTCVVCIVACPASRVVWASHLDQQPAARDVLDLQAALARMRQPRVWMAGGYCDAQGAGPRLALGVLQLLHSLEQPLRLVLCCVGEANTRPDGSPATRQLLLDTGSWEPRAWLFADGGQGHGAPTRGPALARRLAAQHCRPPHRTLVPVWSAAARELVLPPFDPTLPPGDRRAYQQLLAAPDAQLALMSTSPAHEPAWFVADMRSMLAFMIAAQNLESPERRAALTTARWRMGGDGSWQEVAVEAAVQHRAASREVI